MQLPKLVPIYLSVIFWHVGSGLVLPFIPIWLRSDIGEGSFMVLGFMLSIQNVLAIIGISFISNFTDKRGHYRPTILVINLIGVVEYAILTTITSSQQYLVVVATAAIIFGAYYTTIQAYATNICAVEERGRVTSYLMLSASVGWFAGASLGGIGFQTVGMPILLAAASSLFFFAGLSVFLAPPSSHVQELEDKQLEVTSTWKLLRRKSLLIILLPMIIIDLTAGAFFAMVSVFLDEGIGLSSDLIGYGNGIATVLGALALLVIGPTIDRYGRRPIYLFGVFIYPVVFILFSVYHDPTFVFILFSIPTYAFLRPIVPAMISDVTAPHERSRGMALVTISSSLSILIGAVGGGYLADTTSLGVDVWTIIPAIFGWLAVFVAVFFVKETLQKPQHRKVAVEIPITVSVREMAER